MKILSNISRFLLALIFTILGLNGFLHFILGTTLASNYLLVFFALQLISGGLLLINRYVPLALTILSPIMMNVLLYGVLMNPARLGFAFFVAILWVVVLVGGRGKGWPSRLRAPDSSKTGKQLGAARTRRAKPSQLCRDC